MPWYSYFAIFFIVWWLVLFAVLPFGVRSQREEDEIEPGTDQGAPSSFSLWRKLLATTLVTFALMAVYYGLTTGLGYSFDDIPRMVPSYE